MKEGILLPTLDHDFREPPFFYEFRERRPYHRHLDPKIVAAAKDAIDQFGTSTGTFPGLA